MPTEKFMLDAATGKFLVRDDGFAVSSACCPEPSPCAPCLSGSYNFKGCIDRIASLTFGIQTNWIACRHLRLNWWSEQFPAPTLYPPGMHFDCPNVCPGLPQGGVLLDGVAWMYANGYANFLLGGTKTYTPGAIVTVTKHAGRGIAEWDAANHRVIIGGWIEDGAPGPDCYDITVEWTCP